MDKLKWKPGDRVRLTYPGVWRAAGRVPAGATGTVEKGTAPRNGPESKFELLHVVWDKFPNQDGYVCAISSEDFELTAL